MTNITKGLLDRLFGRSGVTPKVNSRELRHYIQQYVNTGRNPASLQRYLNRRGVSTRDLGFAKITRQVQDESSNRRRLEGRRSTLKPRPGRDMIASQFKIPANYRYVLEVTYRDPQDGELYKSTRSIYSQERLSKGAAEALGVIAAEQGLINPRGGYDPSAVLEVQGASLFQAYYNKGSK